MNEEEAQLCASLGYPAQPIFVNPLPNSDEVKEFANRIRSLKEERLLRYTTYTKLRDEIITIAAELELKPSLQFGQMVFAGGDDFALTSANMVCKNLVFFLNIAKIFLLFGFVTCNFNINETKYCCLGSFTNHKVF